MPDKATIFRDLHRPGDPFILANAWDAGSARMLVALGARAIATSSGAHAFTLGRPDMGTITRDEALTHAADLVAAVNVPVSGDFENGFGEAPETVAETVRLAAEAGLAGICIEDTALPETGAYDFDLAVERIRAAASAARALPGDFFLVARADGVLTGAYDHAESLRRVLAFQDVGADGIYVPLPKTPEDLAAICAAATVPVNALAAGPVYAKLTRADYGRMGVARISLGAALARVTHRAIMEASAPLFAEGDFSGLTRALPAATLDPLLDKGMS